MIARSPLFCVGDEMKRFVRVEVGVAPRSGHGLQAPVDAETKDRKKMGRSTGLEPATLGTTNRCSNQLSYDRHDAPLGTRWLLKGAGRDLQASAAATRRHASHCGTNKRGFG